MSPDQITRLFTQADGNYRFARWGRPIAPIVFGVADETLPFIKGGIEAVMAHAGHRMAETDPELGANLMFFFLRDWDELTHLPDLDRLVPNLGGLLARLKAGDANRYRLFRFDERDAIRACFVFLRMDEALTAEPVAAIALSQAVQAALLWGEAAFADSSPLAKLGVDGVPVLRPDIAAVLRAAYDPVLPSAANDPAHALRLFARVAAMETRDA
jgi:hypothetical protein